MAIEGLFLLATYLGIVTGRRWCRTAVYQSIVQGLYIRSLETCPGSQWVLLTAGKMSYPEVADGRAYAVYCSW